MGLKRFLESCVVTPNRQAYGALEATEGMAAFGESPASINALYLVKTAMPAPDPDKRGGRCAWGFKWSGHTRSPLSSIA